MFYSMNTENIIIKSMGVYIEQVSKEILIGTYTKNAPRTNSQQTSIRPKAHNSVRPQKARVCTGERLP